MAAAARTIGSSTECFTVGYEGLEISEFLEKLESAGVKQVVDIRERAQSRKRGFSGKPLRTELAEEGISYRHIPELGSPTAIRTRYRATRNFDSFRRDYERYLKTRETYLALLATLIAVQRTALLCFERDSAACHRSLVSHRLERRGFSFNHL